MTLAAETELTGAIEVSEKLRRSRVDRPVVWLLEPYCAIPGDALGYPHGMLLAEMLVDHGFDVVYWASSFSHATKKHRGADWEDRQIRKGLTIRIVPTRAYEKHVGFKRLMWLFDYAYGIWTRGKCETAPSCIYLPLPMPFGDVVAVLLKRLHHTTLVTDLRDLWPELFVSKLPKRFSKLAKVLFWPLYRSRKYALDNSDGFTAASRTYRNLAIDQSPKLSSVPGEVVYYSGVQLESFRKLMSSDSCDTQMLTKVPGETWAICAGTVGEYFDIDTLLSASRILEKQAPSLKIIISGNGPRRQQLERYIEENRPANVSYVGVLDLPTLCRYYAKAELGLSIYTEGSTVVLPTKAYDYFSAELPVVNSLKGEFEDYLRDNRVGVQYAAGDPISLAHVLSDLANDKGRISDMKKGLATIGLEFDRQKQYMKFVNLIADVRNAR